MAHLHRPLHRPAVHAAAVLDHAFAPRRLARDGKADRVPFDRSGQGRFATPPGGECAGQSTAVLCQPQRSRDRPLRPQQGQLPFTRHLRRWPGLGGLCGGHGLLSHRIALGVVHLNRTIGFHDLLDLSGVAHRHHLHGVEVEVGAGHPLHLGGGHGHELSGIGVPVVLREAVNLDGAGIAQELGGPLQREREVGHHGPLGLLQFLLRHGLVPDAPQLVEELRHRAFGDFGPQRPAHAPGAGIHQSSEGAGHAVGVALLLAQVQEQPRRRPLSEHAVHHHHRDVVRVAPVDGNVAHRQAGLHRVGPVHHIDLLGGNRRGIRRQLDLQLSSLPLPQPLLQLREQVGRADIAGKTQDGVLRGIALPMPLGQCLRREGVHRLRCRRPDSSRMVAVHRPVEALAHQEARRRALLAQTGLEPLLELVQLVSRKGGMEQHVSEQREPLFEVVAQPGSADCRRSRPKRRRGTQGGTQPRHFLGDLPAGARLRAFVQHLRGHHRQPRQVGRLKQRPGAGDAQIHRHRRQAVVFHDQHGETILQSRFHRPGQLDAQDFLRHRRQALALDLADRYGLRILTRCLRPPGRAHGHH